MPQRGTVKFYDADKGYGVIEVEDGREAVVIHSSFKGRRRIVLHEGQKVELELVSGPKGLEARDVGTAGWMG